MRFAWLRQKGSESTGDMNRASRSVFVAYNAIWWVPVDTWTSIAIRAGEAVNETSLRIGEYEALKEAALDPYIMIRNAYVQNRNKLIAE